MLGWERSDVVSGFDERVLRSGPGSLGRDHQAADASGQ